MLLFILLHNVYIIRSSLRTGKILNLHLIPSDLNYTKPVINKPGISCLQQLQLQTFPYILEMNIQNPIKRNTLMAFVSLHAVCFINHAHEEKFCMLETPAVLVSLSFSCIMQVSSSQWYVMSHVLVFKDVHWEHWQHELNFTWSWILYYPDLLSYDQVAFRLL